MREDGKVKKTFFFFLSDEEEVNKIFLPFKGILDFLYPTFV